MLSGPGLSTVPGATLPAYVAVVRCVKPGFCRARHQSADPVDDRGRGLVLVPSVHVDPARSVRSHRDPGRPPVRPPATRIECHVVGVRCFRGADEGTRVRGRSQTNLRPRCVAVADRLARGPVCPDLVGFADPRRPAWTTPRTLGLATPSQAESDRGQAGVRARSGPRLLHAATGSALNDQDVALAATEHQEAAMQPIACLRLSGLVGQALVVEVGPPVSDGPPDVRA